MRAKYQEVRDICRHSRGDALNGFFIVSVLAAVLLTMSFTEPVAGASTPKLRVVQKIEDFRLPHHENGVLTWQLAGMVAHIFNNRDVLLEAPRLAIAKTQEKPGYDITAKRGRITEKNNVMIFEGDVVIVSTDGTTMRTDSLRWQVDIQTATTDSHVVVKRGKMNLSGDGLKAKADSRTFTLLSNAKMIIPQEKMGYDRPDTVTIFTAGSMTFSGDVATFNDRPTVLSASGKMISDSLDLHLDNKTEKIKKAVATGNVDSTSEEMISKSDTAVWTPGSDDVALTGNVVMEQKGAQSRIRSNAAYMKPEEGRILCPGPAEIIFYPEKKE